MSEAWSVVVTRDPEWVEPQRDLMVALAQLEQRTCRGCQSDLAKSLDVGAAAHGVNVDDESVCYVCSAKESHERQLHETHKDDPAFFDGRIIYAHLPEVVTRGGS